MTRSFLPLVTQSGGRVVNMSSLTGQVPMEGYGAYSTSKAGLEAYSDVLRLEMARQKVKVSIIEPSGYQTGAVTQQSIQARKEEVWSELEGETKDRYGRAYYDSLYHNFESSIPFYPHNLVPVVDAVKSALLARRPKARYQVGRGASVLIHVVHLLPQAIADWLVASIGFGVRNMDIRGNGNGDIAKKQGADGNNGQEVNI